MARGLMQAINISPGQPVYVEDYRMQDQGLEWNAQNELDYRTEYLMTNRVVMEEISSETLWGLTGWTPANSLKITQVTGNLVCDVGMSSIGGRRHVRTSSGNISPTGTSGDDTYWIRAKYDTSSDTHTFIGESTSSPPQADTSTDKRVTLATAVKAGGVWTGTPVDKRTSNTQLTPPAVISGDAGSNPVLSLHQEGSGLGLLVTGGDVSVGDATYNQQLIVYGTSTYGITIYDDPNGYSVEMIAGAANTLKVQTIGGTAATITAANIAAVGGPVISSTGIDMNTDSITNATGVTATTITGTTVTGTSVVAGASGITSSGAISAPTATNTINGLVVSAGYITTGGWNAMTISASKGGTGQAGYTVGDILYANSTTTLAKLGVGASNAVLMGGINPTWDATPSVSTITTSGNITCGGVLQVSGNDIKDSAGTIRITLGATTIIGGDIQLSGNDIKDAGGNVILSSGGTGQIDALGAIACNILIHSNPKYYDIATSLLPFDDCYADDWLAVSSWKTFADPSAVLKKFRPTSKDEYKIDHKSIDDWMCARVKCKVKKDTETLEWEGGYVLKSGKAKIGARVVHDERLKKDVKVGNYADGYTDEDFEHEEAYSVNKTQVVLIQAMNQLKDESNNLISRIAALESRIHTLESAS